MSFSPALDRSGPRVPRTLASCFAISGVLLGFAPGLAAQWIIDNGPSRVEFSVTHLVLDTVHGTFDEIEGMVTTKEPETLENSMSGLLTSDDTDLFEGATITVSIPVDSVSSGIPDRDRELLGNDFLAAEEFPSMRFVSRPLQRIGQQQYSLVGELTIRGRSHETTFEANFLGIRETSLGHLRADFVATTRIDRFSFGVHWSEHIDGTFLVGRWIDIELRIALLHRSSESFASQESPSPKLSLHKSPTRR